MPDPYNLTADYAACGVALRVNIPYKKAQSMYIEYSHALVLEGLKDLVAFEYRSGYNPVTDESDGAGIKLYGLPSAFFNKKIATGAFQSVSGDVIQHCLKDNCFVIGQYFMPLDDDNLIAAKALITTCAKKNSLAVLGWRDLTNSVNFNALSDTARQKMPALWQCIMVHSPSLLAEGVSLEHAALKASLELSYQARQQKLKLHIVSQSSESIVYKGMIKPSLMAAFYQDLADKDFTASAVAIHTRFATNTDPQWANAQPCVFFWLHNGELNSAYANAAEMRSELDAWGFQGIYPDKNLSDSMQFDADLANQMVLKDLTLIEAFLRLMPPSQSDHYPAEVNAMLRCFGLERTPYNGPTFAVAGSAGYFMAKLDHVGLRPSRWGIIKTSSGCCQLMAASDDILIAPAGGAILQKGHLEPGGLIMVTPAGEVLETPAILNIVCDNYHSDRQDYFQAMLADSLCSLNVATCLSSFEPNLPTVLLNRLLFSAGWDYEAMEHDVRYMADHGVERVAAMGDDTNPLWGAQVHVSHYFHQLFAQVTAPPLDSIRERDRFNLATTLGPMLGKNKQVKQMMLSSPILGVNHLDAIEHHPEVHSSVLDTSFELHQGTLSSAIKNLLIAVEQAVTRLGSRGGIIILSDRYTDINHPLIPDLIAVAAVWKHLELKNLMRHVSIVADSYQITGPHQAAALLAVGAKAVYPRGAYAKIRDFYRDASSQRTKINHYHAALEIGLLKTMGKMGVPDINNYVNSHLLAALGLDFSTGEKEAAEGPSLASIFSGFFSPLKGFQLSHLSQQVIERHQHAYNPFLPFTLFPRSGYYMPEKDGIKHGYGPEVINAFTNWIKAEDIRAKQWQMHTILERHGYPGFVPDAVIFTPERGFLNPLEKKHGHPLGTYPRAYLERFSVSDFFQTLSNTLNRYSSEHPTSIRDYLFIVSKDSQRIPTMPIQSQADIRKLLFSGSMSQGALTVSEPKNSKKLGAHELLAAGINAIGAMSASGEGGESHEGLRDPLATNRSKQIASGRFSVSAMQILQAEEVEIKMAQGAKPGEGGEVPGSKISIRFAAQRGGLPGTTFISPPPHHDIYSIEDLEELIYDIKSVNPAVKISVKLVSSKGIGTIAAGVVKAGADVINIAGNSGGTGAAFQSSIKHAGLPAELGLVEVDKVLRQAKLRDLVQLRTSGGIKTAEDVIISAILGADLFELGTTAMLTLGCKMQRTCNSSCQPGVATDGHLFKGDQLNVERYFVNLAASIQNRLRDLGFQSLRALRGHTALLAVRCPDMKTRYDFSVLLDRSDLPAPVDAATLDRAIEKRLSTVVRTQEDALILEIQRTFASDKSANFKTRIRLTTQDRSFGARIAGRFAAFLENNPKARITLYTKGIAGQSFGFVMPQGMSIIHDGSVQDGCAKSMTGGELILCTPNQNQSYKAELNTLAGNAVAYGASGGKIFVNGVAGHRCGVLLKGAQVIVEGAGDLAFEYMTSGTAMIIGRVGRGLCAGASGGIVFVYDKDNQVVPANAVRVAAGNEQAAYADVIRTMLQEHVEKTKSFKACEILADFNLEDFKVLIPNDMSHIRSLQDMIQVLETFQLRNSPLTPGMHVWLEQKILPFLEPGVTNSHDELRQLFEVLATFDGYKCLAARCAAMLKNDMTRPLPDSSQLLASVETDFSPQKQRAISKRLGSIAGKLDDLFLDVLNHIKAYVGVLHRDATGCSSCQAQSCSGSENTDTGCPSGKSINTINATLKRLGNICGQALSKEQWITLREAFEIQIQPSPFIGYTGAACPAPCEDACTETIPNSGPPNPLRGGKPIGEGVHIKNIEHCFYQLGDALGWFDGETVDIAEKLGDDGLHYEAAMKAFKPPFQKVERVNRIDKTLIIVGSGPAAMQIAYEALVDGVETVRMYEKSDKPGGLLMDGIPAHKFDKNYVIKDFARLKNMGLELYLNSEVFYDPATGDYCVKDSCIANSHNDKQFVVLCVGAGLPRALPAQVTASLGDNSKIIQAIDLLKVANDVADSLKRSPHMTEGDKEALITSTFAHRDPRGKRIVVIGGGDTAQDVTRWVARYFCYEERGGLNIVVRGPKPGKRGVQDGYPALSKAPTKENKMLAAEVNYVGGQVSYLVVPQSITTNTTGRLTVELTEHQFKYHEQIQADPRLKKLAEALPREMRPLDAAKSKTIKIDNVDLVLCALGFLGPDSIPIIKAVKSVNAKNVYIAGDAAGEESLIIIGAQANASKTYKQIREAMGCCFTC